MGKPPRNYKFPFSVHKKLGKDENRYAGHQHLEKFPWVVFSDAKKGLFVNIDHFF